MMPIGLYCEEYLTRIKKRFENLKERAWKDPEEILAVIAY